MATSPKCPADLEKVANGTNAVNEFFVEVAEIWKLTTQQNKGYIFNFHMLVDIGRFFLALSQYCIKNHKKGTFN